MNPSFHRSGLSSRGRGPSTGGPAAPGARAGALSGARSGVGAPGVAGLVLLLGGLVLTVPPEGARAQACLGDPAREGEGTISGMALFNGGPTSYGGEIRANLVGPIALGGTFLLTELPDVDDDVFTFAGNVAYDVAVETPTVALCPVVGVQYSRWDDEIAGTGANRSEFRFPLGVGLGLELGDRESAALIPSATGGWFYYTERESLDDEGVFNAEATRTGSGAEFFGEAGVTLVVGSLFLRGSLLTDLWREDDPMVRLLAGLRF